MKMSESFVHVSMREFLKNSGWLLIAGEFPSGSDDELNVLSIADPTVAKDNSPDPRRHSIGEIVPDLVAYKEGRIIVIEAKSQYSGEDKIKLEELMNNKKSRLIKSLKKFVSGKPQFDKIDFYNVKYIPVLAFGNPSYNIPCIDAGFGHIYIKSLTDAKMVYFER